jgi:hypothetical protein
MVNEGRESILVLSAGGGPSDSLNLSNNLAITESKLFPDEDVVADGKGLLRLLNNISRNCGGGGITGKV